MAARLQRIEEAGCRLPEEAVTAAVLDAKLEEHQRRLEVAQTVQMRKLQSHLTSLADVQREQALSESVRADLSYCHY